jgi:hypothetical protein
MTSSRMSTAMIGMPSVPMLSQPIAPTSNPSRLNRNMGAMGPPPTNRLMAPTSNPLGMNGGMVEMSAPMSRQVQPGVINETIPEVVSPVPRQPQPVPTTNGHMSDMNSVIPAQTSDFSYDGLPAFANQPSLHSWELPLRFVPPTGPVDSILIGLLQRQRSLALSGTTEAALIGPYHPNLRGLVNLEDSASTHPISSVLADLIRRTQLKGLAEKSAALYVIYRLTQWQISPSAETYNNLPDWYGPRASQLLTGHPIWSTLVLESPSQLNTLLTEK